MSEDEGSRQSASEDDLFGGSDNQGHSDVDQTMSSDEEIARPIKRAHVDIQRVPQSYDRTVSEFALARIPGFLMIDPKPLSTEEFLQQEPSDVGAFLAENTLRWRFGTSEDGADMIKESNARLVEWEDGTLTLQLGSEQFEIKSQHNPDPVFLTTHFANKNLYQTRHLSNKSLTIMPTSTSSRTHQRLAAVLAAKHERAKTAIGSVATYVDPEKMQRDLEKAELFKDRARRKLETDRDRISTGYQRARSSGDFSDDDNITTSRLSRAKMQPEDYKSEADSFGSSAEEREEEEESTAHETEEEEDLDQQAQRLEAAKKDFSEGDNMNRMDANLTDDEKPRPIRRTAALDDDSD